MKTLITSALVAAIAMGATAASAGTTYKNIIDPSTNLLIGQEISNTETGEVISVTSLDDTAFELFHHNKQRVIYLTGGNGRALSTSAAGASRDSVAASEVSIADSTSVIEGAPGAIADLAESRDTAKEAVGADVDAIDAAYDTGVEQVETSVSNAEANIADEKASITSEKKRQSRNNSLTKEQVAKLKAVVAMYMANK